METGETQVVKSNKSANNAYVDRYEFELMLGELNSAENNLVEMRQQFEQRVDMGEA